MKGALSWCSDTEQTTPLIKGNEVGHFGEARYPYYASQIARQTILNL